MRTIIFIGLDFSRLALAALAEIASRSDQEDIAIYFDEAEDLYKRGLPEHKHRYEYTRFEEDEPQLRAVVASERRRPDCLNSEPQRTKQQMRGRVKTQHQRLSKGWY